LVRTNSPTNNDFRSQRSEKPDNPFSVPECQARGLSVFSELEDAKKKTRLKNLKGTLACRVTLTKGAGYIQQTGRRNHYTWWPLADFDILAHCKVMK